jgi:glutathione synthase/RimK-type ligase-like ATP-grasp enzyme
MTDAGARIGIVTGEAWPSLTDSDRLLADELEGRGHAVRPAIWDDPAVAWAEFDLVVLRSCFDYHETPEAFRDWLDRVAATDATVLNPVPVLRWNMHKFYLEALIEAGVEILETAFVAAGSNTQLVDVLRDRGWDQAVVKPAIATSSANAWRTDLESASTDQERFEAALADGDHLVQAYAPEIADGERSLVFIDESFSHAWRSIPAEDEFRSHGRFGGTAESFDPPAELVDQAAAVLETARTITDRETAAEDGWETGAEDGFTYARVDGIERDGRFVLMELELVEPFLGLHRSADAPARLADAVLERL